MAILLIEDDPAVQELVTALLSSAGFTVDTASDGTTGHRLCASEKYEVIILDLGLPDMDGLELLRQMRAEGITTHILILTAKDDPEDRVLGLDTGADDYLSKPCVLPELAARVRALLRRKYNAKNPILTVGDLQINSATRAAARAGKHVPLTPREYEVFRLVVTGMLNKQIAFQLGTVEKTVKVHRARVMAKMGAQSIADLVRFADKLGIRSSPR